MTELTSLSKNILFRRVADEGVVVDQHHGQVMVVNETAIRILELWREFESVQSVVEKIAEKYDATPEQIESDVIGLLRQVNNHQFES